MNKLFIVVLFSLFLSACTLTEKRIETITKVVNSPPVYLNKPVAPTLSEEQVITFTLKDAQYLSEACSDFREGNVLPNEYNGLDEASACSWAIQGFTSQGWLNVQQNLILIENYVKRLEEQRDFYERQLKDRYEQEEKDE